MTEFRPNDIAQSEQALVGLALTGVDLSDLGQTVRPEDFASRAFGVIWKTVLAVNDAGQLSDMTTVAAELARTGDVQRVDDMVLMDALAAGAYVVDGEWHAKRIAEAGERRRIGTAALTIAHTAEDETLSITEVRERARQQLEDALVNNTRTGPKPIGEVLERVIASAEKTVSPTLSSGWPDLDRFIGGLAPGRLVVIGARPAVGKSITGTNLARHFATAHGHAVLIASMEMSDEEVVHRITADLASVNVSRFAEGELEEREWDSVRDHHGIISELPIYIADEPSQTVASIRTAAREVLRIRPDLAVIVVDYLQLMESGSKSGNRAEAVGQMSRGLKILARETNTCVVAMAQVNRAGLTHGDGRPKMSDLRESGAIEADANVVILLHRPDENIPEVEAIVAKNRHGAKGTATLSMQGHYARLASTGWQPPGRSA